MRVSTSGHFVRWTRGLGLVALVALLVLAWSVFAPGGLFWTAVLAAGLIGSAAATVLLVRSREVPSLAQVIASVEAEPVVAEAGRKG
jgi:hypothetical protein